MALGLIFGALGVSVFVILRFELSKSLRLRAGGVCLELKVSGWKPEALNPKPLTNFKRCASSASARPYVGRKT